MVSQAELGRLFGVSRQTIYQLTRAGRLTPVARNAIGAPLYSVLDAERYFGYSAAYPDKAAPIVDIDVLMAEIGHIDITAWSRKNL